MKALSVVYVPQRRASVNPQLLDQDPCRASKQDFWHGRQRRVDLAVLTRLCIELQCKPGDILILEEGEGMQKTL